MGDEILVIKGLLTAAKEAELMAAVKLRGLLSEGDRIEYKYGGMAYVNGATVVRVCAAGGYLGVVAVSDGLDTEIKIPATALVPPVPKSKKSPVDLTYPSCPKCVDGLKPWQDRLECPCGNVLVRCDG